MAIDRWLQPAASDAGVALNTKTRSSLAAIVLVLLPGAAQATSICRWVDQAGRTHFAEVVPDPYRKAAVCTESQGSELPADQRRAAEQRAAQDKARARQAASSPAAKGPAGPPRPSAAASGAAAKRPIEVVTDTTSCLAWWRIYDESVACFGPYRTTRGATKPEGFEKCNVVPSPEPRCGPRSN